MYFYCKNSYPLEDSDNFEKSEELNRVLEVQLIVKDKSIDLSQQIV